MKAIWRIAETRGIAVGISAAAITSPELCPEPEDQFPIIRGTRIYIRERGNKYVVYTAVHLHRTARRGRGLCRSPRNDGKGTG